MAANRPALRDHVRALVPPFWGRFFDTDLAPGSNELRSSLIQLVAFLAMPGFIVPFFMAFAFDQRATGPDAFGWNLLALHQGVDALRAAALRDKALYLGASMAASGLIAAITWSSLLVSRRDVLVLGVMPVGAVAIVTAKLVALAGFSALLAASMHACAAVSFGTFLAAENTALFLARGILAHFVAAFGISVWVMFAIAAMQGLAMSLVGPRRFERWSSILQMLLVAGVVAGLVLLPGASRRVSVSIAALSSSGFVDLVMSGPVLWFVGLYETVLGTLNPELHALGATAVSVFALTAGVTVLTFAVSYRRLMLEALAVPSASPRRGRITRWAASLTSRDLDVRTIAEFLLTSVARVPRHRFVMASALGVGLAWGLPGWIALAQDATRPTVAAIGIPYALVLFLTMGLRVAASLPTDLGARWLFDFSVLHWRPVRLAVERTMLVVGVLPVVAISAVAIGWLWGTQAAVVHAFTTGLTGFLLVELALLRFRGVPCLGHWSPGGLKLRVLWPVYLLGLSAVTLGIPATERWIFDSPALAGLYCVVLATGALAARRASVKYAGARVLSDHLAIMPEGYPVVRERRAGDGSEASARRIGPKITFAAFTSLGWRDRLLAAARWIASVRPLSWWPGAETIRRDVVSAARMVAARPMISAISVLTVSIGVAATATVYAVLHAVLLKPVDIPDVGRVVNIYDAYPFSGLSAPNMMLSWLEFSDLRERQTVYAEVAGFANVGDELTIGGIEQNTFGESVTADYFSLVRPKLTLGRGIGANDEAERAAVVVLSHRLWRSAFGGDPEILGRTVRLGERTFEVIGVTSAEFRGVAAANLRPTELWIPVTASTEWASRGNDIRLMVKARLKTGTTLEEARNELGRMAARLDRESPLNPDPRYRRRWWLSPAGDVKLLEPFTRIATPITLLLMGAAALLLSATCSSLATLTFARHVARHRDYVVRLAFGASPYALLRAHLVEAGLIVSAGGLVSWMLTRATIASIVGSTIRLGPGFNGQVSPEFHGPVWLVFGGSLAVAFGVVGLWPGWRLLRRASQGCLTASSTHTSPVWRTERTLVVLQVAAAVVFLTATMIFGGGLVQRAWHDPGMDLDRVSVVRLAGPRRPEDVASLRASIDALRRGMNSDRRVQIVTVAANLPLSSGPLPTEAIAGLNSSSVTRIPTVYAESDIFRALDIPFRAGTWFGDANGVPQIVLSELAARQVFGSAVAVGQTVVVRRRVGPAQRDTTMIVTGVTRDTDVGVAGRREALAFLPLRESTFNTTMLVVRAAPDSENLASHLPGIIRRYAPELRVRESVAGPVATGVDSVVDRAFGLVAGIMGLGALLLAMLGLSGVLLQHVSERTKDIGIRSALGATSRALVRMVVGDAARATLAGVALGAFVSWMLWSFARTLLTTLLPPIVWPALVVVPIVIGVAMLLACYLPAKQATVIDAVRAMRD